MNIYIPAHVMSLLGIRPEYEGKFGNSYRLTSNGMSIVLCPNPNTSSVVLNVLYGVGSRNEPPCGATHFLEHLMFKGSTKFNKRNGNDIETLHKKIGALNNATTWRSRTNYYTQALPHYLRLILEIEADRMRGLEFTQEDRDTEMGAVRNEFERGENDPAEALDKAVWAAAFTVHPYKVSTIGSLEEVENVTVEQLMKFYDTFYWPNNATVILHGNFDPQEALTHISQLFGKIPAKEIPNLIAVEPKQQGERRTTVKRAGDLPMVHIAFHVPEAQHPDTYALTALAGVLGSSNKRSSRLYKALVDTNLAISVSCSSVQDRDPALFEIVATVAPGQTPQKVEEVILAELEKAKVELVQTSELRALKQSMSKQIILESVDPSRMIWPVNEDISSVGFEWFDKFSDKLNAVTREQVKAVAVEYLHEDNRTVGHFIPTSESEDDTSEEQELVEDSDDNPPKLTKGLQRVTLANGLRLLVLPKPGTAVVSLTPKFLNGGSGFSGDINGFAASMVADMLTYGSKGLSKLALARTLENMGISELEFEAGDLFCSMDGISVVKEDFPKFLSVLSKVICKPLFNKKEFAKLRERTKGDLENLRTDEEDRAETAFYQALYDSDHPYYQDDLDETLEELNSLTRDDLVKFYQANYSPKSTIVSIVGDITVEQATELMEKNFGNWSGQELRPVNIPEVAIPAEATRKEIFLKDKTSASILIGLPASLKQSDSDYFAAHIANSALGVSTIDARLGKVIRVAEGLTYGVYSLFRDPSFGYAPWYITLTVNPENIEKAIQLVEQIVRTYLDEGIGEEELQDEKTRIVGYYYIGLGSPDVLANKLATYEAIGLGAEYVDAFADRIEAVTLDEVNAAARKYFDLDHAVTVVSGTIPKKS